MVNGRNVQSSVILAYRGKQGVGRCHGPSERLLANAAPSPVDFAPRLDPVLRRYPDPYPFSDQSHPRSTSRRRPHPNPVRDAHHRRTAIRDHGAMGTFHRPDVHSSNSDRGGEHSLGCDVPEAAPATESSSTGDTLQLAIHDDWPRFMTAPPESSIVSDFGRLSRAISASPIVSDLARFSRAIDASPIVSDLARLSRAIDASPIVSDLARLSRAIDASPIVSDLNRLSRAVATSTSALSLERSTRTLTGKSTVKHLVSDSRARTCRPVIISRSDSRPNVMSYQDGRSEPAYCAHSDLRPDRPLASPPSGDSISTRFEFCVSLGPTPIPPAIEAADPEATFDSRYWWMLNALEQRLRSVVERNLSRSVGSKWVKQRVPQEVREQWIRRQEEDRESGRPVYAAIQYADFMDLADVVARRDNWREVFRHVFSDCADITAAFRRLHPIRKAIAHGRPLSRIDTLTLVSETVRIFHVLRLTVLH